MMVLYTSDIEASIAPSPPAELVAKALAARKGREKR
jgi:hypothetical protein